MEDRKANLVDEFLDIGKNEQDQDGEQQHQEFLGSSDDELAAYGGTGADHQEMDYEEYERLRLEAQSQNNAADHQQQKQREAKEADEESSNNSSSDEDEDRGAAKSKVDDILQKYYQQKGGQHKDYSFSSDEDSVEDTEPKGEALTLGAQGELQLNYNSTAQTALSKQSSERMEEDQEKEEEVDQVEVAQNMSISEDSDKNANNEKDEDLDLDKELSYIQKLRAKISNNNSRINAISHQKREISVQDDEGSMPTNLRKKMYARGSSSSSSDADGGKSPSNQPIDFYAMQKEVPQSDKNKSEDSSEDGNQAEADDLKPSDLVQSTSDMTFAELQKEAGTNDRYEQQQYSTKQYNNQHRTTDYTSVPLSSTHQPADSHQQQQNVSLSNNNNQQEYSQNILSPLQMPQPQQSERTNNLDKLLAMKRQLFQQSNDAEQQQQNELQSVSQLIVPDPPKQYQTFRQTQQNQSLYDKMNLTDEEQENDTESFNLTHSQLTYNMSQYNQIPKLNSNRERTYSNSNNDRHRKMLMSLIILKKQLRSSAQGERDVRLAFLQIKTNIQTAKIANSAVMIQKMSNLSRSFIGSNLLKSVVLKKDQRSKAKCFRRLNHNQAQISAGESKAKNLRDEQQQQQMLQMQQMKEQMNQLTVQTQEIVHIKDQEIHQLKTQLQNKNEDLQKMETMFKEYASWRSKLELIEQKMKSEVDYWKSSAEKIQKENEKVQHELLVLTKEQMTKAREMADKDDMIAGLKEQLANSGKDLDTVEEALCPQCKKSLEESIDINFQKDMLQQVDRQKVLDLEQQLQQAVKQNNQFKERAAYMETLEKEQKKELEEHVDVLLKMEQERLILIKETQKLKEEKTDLTLSNQNYQTRLEQFETHLNALRDEISNSQKTYKQLVQEKEKVIESQKAEIDKLKARKGPMVSSQKSMTGLPKNFVSQSQSTLKFKTKSKANQDFSDTSSQASTMSSRTASAAAANPNLTDKQLVHDNQMLTNELIVLSRDMTKMKSELKQKTELLKKTEKERAENKKNLDQKEQALDKLRIERDELFTLVNTDKYRDFKTVEEEKIKFENKLNQLQQEMVELQKDYENEVANKAQLQDEVQQLKFQNSRGEERAVAQEKLLQTLEEKSIRQSTQLDKSEEISKQTTDFLEQLKKENSQLKNDVQWLANSAKNNKMQSEKAIQDLEEYARILKLMEQKLVQSEKLKDQKTQECMDLQNCLNKLMAQMPQLGQQNQNTQKKQHQMQVQPQQQMSMPTPQPAPQRFDMYEQPRQQPPQSQQQQSITVRMPQQQRQPPGSGFNR